MTFPNSPVARHAVVIGASMGGMLAARALADFFERVTIVERDTLPEPGEHRKGVPQGRHTHALLSSGRDVLEGLFPGLTEDLVSMGAPRAYTTDLRWYDGGGYHCRFTIDDEENSALMVSRPLLEGYVRQRLRALPNVAVIERCDALGLAMSERGTSVIGLRILRRAPGSAAEVVEADLVVDASGRASRAPQWLAEQGYEPPQEERITVDVGYVTRLYRRGPDDLGGTKVVITNSAPGEGSFGGVMLAQEGERWTVTLAGYGGNYPPMEEEPFLAAARSLPAPDIYEIVSRNEPLSDFIPYRFPASVRHRYERLTRVPEGFLVFGDAICSFNPIYGQGMSVAALEAADLQRSLREGLPGLWRRFLSRAARTVDNPWQIVASGDLRRPEAEGKRTVGMGFVNWYMSRLHVAARRDPVVALAFHRVAMLQAPPASVMRPGVVFRVVRGNL
ncbi:MAG TPA: monooxygenase [Dehalococcoidia bacterium]|nr:monooxygenase [Dehalococcoidia bacterium]